MFPWTQRPDPRACQQYPPEESETPWIKTISDAKATGELASLYRELRKEQGQVPNVHRILSLFPDALRANMELGRTLLHNETGELSRIDVELIATIVSLENCCDYCAQHHEAALLAECRRRGEESPLVSAQSNELSLTPRQRAMLDLATRLSQTPYAVAEDDIAEARDAGFTDRGILEIILVGSYFSFINRIVLALGVPMENPADHQEAD